MTNRHQAPRRGFSLVEVLIAIAILAMASSALLLATQGSSASAEFSLEQTIATGLAAQLADEVLGHPYKEKSATPYGWPLQPESGELSDPIQRVLFDDTDDFHGYQATPLEDAWAIPLGTGDDAGGLRLSSFALPSGFFNGWTATTDVRYADEDDPSQDLPAGTTSGIRSLRVTIARLDNGVEQELASVRRLYAYVPPPS